MRVRGIGGGKFLRHIVFPTTQPPKVFQISFFFFSNNPKISELHCAESTLAYHYSKVEKREWHLVKGEADGGNKLPRPGYFTLHHAGLCGSVGCMSDW